MNGEHSARLCQILSSLGSEPDTGGRGLVIAAEVKATHLLWIRRADMVWRNEFAKVNNLIVQHRLQARLVPRETELSLTRTRWV